ncbi:hypothetical protein DSLASN_12780 [Desulfoluna limicola]|uniref:HTH luxR-type domain-containing protein n=1 Tax=Desulfoluna limicola TaxID=2810562 RepID=A0ABN6F2B7_9BACT|nr:helix-turn-helix transcriptional regulator [Desulfoluna limicola]BCS95646.1 hypothetical protein DSLASN_12780 [Desulfoluna limicola]
MSVMLSFCLYLTWLYSIPLEGTLLPGWVDPFHIFYFLAAHVPGFWVLTKIPEPRRPLAIRCSFPTMALLTWALLIPQAESRPLFLAMGFVAAPAVAGILDALRRNRRPLWGAALSLLAANLATFLLQHLPVDLSLKIASVGFFVGFPLFVMQWDGGGQGAVTHAEKSSMPLAFFGLLFAMFYISGGLMFGYLAPRVAEVAIPANSYTLGYLVMIPVGCFLMQRSYDAVIGLSVLLGVAGFTLLSFDSDATLVLGMVLTQASFGVSDMLVVGLTQVKDRRFNEICFIMGTMCFGILSGSLIVMFFGQYLSVLVAAANIMMVLVLVLYNQLRMRQLKLEGQAGQPETDVVGDFLEHPDMACLSEMECQVLRHVMEGSTYKTTGEALDIAESTVKTYMQRMFQKFDCTNKKALLTRVNRIKTAWEAEVRGEEEAGAAYPPQHAG